MLDLFLRFLHGHLKSPRAFRDHALKDFPLSEHAQPVLDKRNLCGNEPVVFDEEILMEKPVQHLVLHDILAEAVHILEDDHCFHNVGNAVF